MIDKTGMFELEVIIHGRPAREYLREAKTFIEGRRGTEFNIRVRNNSHRRACVVLSVDGLSVMNGKIASKEDGAYIINSHQYVDVPGWRLDNKDVAKFYFADLPNSYASQMDKPQNIGVIGGAIFYERMPDFMLYSISPASKGSSDTTRGLGTGFGGRAQHRVVEVSFDREFSPTAVMELRYGDKAELESIGIVLTTPHRTGNRIIEAKPFPADKGCLPPAGWKKPGTR